MPLVVVLFSPGIEVGTSRKYIVLEGFAHPPALCAHVALVGTWQGRGSKCSFARLAVHRFEVSFSLLSSPWHSFLSELGWYLIPASFPNKEEQLRSLMKKPGRHGVCKSR